MRLARSLAAFAVIGTIFAKLVYDDGMGTPWLPLFLLIASWLAPAAFAAQVLVAGYDPLAHLTVADEALEARFPTGTRAIRYEAITRLVRVEAFRLRARAIYAEGQAPLVWFGEMADEPGFVAALAGKTDKGWETLDSLPDPVAGKS